MELRHLRYFVSVAEESVVRRAAALLHIAQPALSRQIQQLEQEIGVALFRREKRRIKLTPAGAAFLARARAILSDAEHAVAAAKAADRGEVGDLSIGFVESAAFGMLPDAVKRFRRQLPGVNVALWELVTNQQLRALHERKIDVGFLRTPIDDSSIATRTVAREPLIAALPVVHRLARRSRIALSQLAGEPFILIPRTVGPNFFDQLVGACRRAGFGPKVAQEAVQMGTIVNLVAIGLGVALVPASLKNLRRSGVVYKRLTKPPIIDLSMAWRIGDTNPTLQRFINSIDPEIIHLPD